MRIGIFDSGVGGLTVLAAIRRRLPGVDLLYLGDTARVPYGGRGARTVKRYALECAQWLVDQGCDHVVIACNTASAYGVEAVRSACSPLPVTGVVLAGAESAASAAGAEGPILVLATRGTVSSQAYLRALNETLPAREIRQRACPLFVPLVEEGWPSGDVLDGVIDHYLSDLLHPTPAALILGCTHYPVLKEHLAKRLPEGLPIIDSSEAIAETLEAMYPDARVGAGHTRLCFTDDPEASRAAIQTIYPAGLSGADQVKLA